MHHPHTEEEYDTIKADASDSLVVVKFGATWCGPCKHIEPVFKTMAKEHTDAVFISVDVDELDSLPDGEDVTGLPTFKFFKGGDLLDEFSGARVDKLKEFVEKYI